MFGTVQPKSVTAYEFMDVGLIEMGADMVEVAASVQLLGLLYWRYFMVP